MAEGTLGAQLFTCREYTKTIGDVAQTLKNIARIGYSTVQISGFGPVDPKEVAKVLADTHLGVAATHMAWDKFRNELDEVIAIHKMWKCKHPAIGGLPDEYRAADGISRFIDELTPIAEELAAEGMDFSYHNHSHEMVRIGDKTWLGMLYEQADPKILKAEIDTYWIQHGGGEPAEWVRKCAGRMPLLHLKDMAIGEDGEQRMAEIGEGNLNWAAILEAAAEAGVEYYLVEQDRCYDRTPFESLEISYRNLRAMGLS